MIWDYESIEALMQLPFFTLINKAHDVHQQNFDVSEMEFCKLLSIKTGACPEDCAYCPQSGHFKTSVKKENLMDLDAVIEDAKVAKENGAKRFCMGAAWKNPPKKDFPKVLEMVKAVKALGLEACITIGMLNQAEALALKEAGLNFYNHNLDSSPEFYKKIITTRTYQDRLDTIAHVSAADIKVCCGGILGMGETRKDRIELLLQLHQLPTPPQSIPINKLMAIKGTPLENAEPIDSFELARTIAVTRLIFPKCRVRLSAGREEMSEESQAWCFMAGANSIFIGDKLLTESNPSRKQDASLLKKLGFNTAALC